MSDEVVRIGVTGHRTFVDVDAAGRQVAAVLDRVAAGRTVEVWSCLAEGADRLAAERVLERADARLVAVLPLDPAEYTRDFEGARSVAEFERLLGRATTVRVTQGAAGTREEAYERAGRVVVDHSDVLLALWDREEGRGRGGTAEVVAYARERGVPVEVVEVRRRPT